MPKQFLPADRRQKHINKKTRRKKVTEWKSDEAIWIKDERRAAKDKADINDDYIISLSKASKKDKETRGRNIQKVCSEGEIHTQI